MRFGRASATMPNRTRSAAPSRASAMICRSSMEVISKFREDGKTRDAIYCQSSLGAQTESIRPD
jgi:hypothetical protein